MVEQNRFLRSRPHPWHGLKVGPKPPGTVYAFIEITPFDLVKYELDKETGFLMVDRPQLTSSLPPTLYGFIPRTYCGSRVAALMTGAQLGDHDPLDICVLSERSISRSDVLLKVNVVGGLPTLDDDHADDKIIAVLANDTLWSAVKDIADLPGALINRLSHYFSTYKAQPNQVPQVLVGEPYGARHAEKVIEAAMADYECEFSDQFNKTTSSLSADNLDREWGHLDQ
jgi:inorganic pyrophosphatase